MADVNVKLKKMYNNVMAQTLSKSGRFLFAGNRFGDIFVYRLSCTDGDGISQDKVQPKRPKLDVYPQKDVEINSLCFDHFLIVGAIGVIYGLPWDEERAELGTKRVWEVRIPMHVDTLQVPDVNHMWLRPDTNQLFAGCGNNVIYQISLEDGRIVREYCGHTNFVHGVTGSTTIGEQLQLYSASEDGTVRLWSEQQKDAVAVLEPYKNTDLVRPEYGNWIGAVATSGDWLLCGGGPKFSIWHLKSLHCIQQFAFPGAVHVCDFVDDNLYVAGEHCHVQFYSMNGELVSSIAVENTATYSTVWQVEPTSFMSIAGFSNKLHILHDFHFLDSKIELYTSD